MRANSHDRGRISLCSTADCRYKCCDFQQGNYIVLYPNELEDAKKLGEQYAHLKIIDHNYHGGKRAVCRASDTSSCDNGYKPLDCASYPLFPKAFTNNHMNSFIKGKKCPLLISRISKHARWVYETWRQLCSANEDIKYWLKNVEFIGYEHVLETEEISIDEHDNKEIASLVPTPPKEGEVIVFQK